MKVIRFFLHYLLGILGILIISCIPVFLQGKPNLDFVKYFHVLWDTIKKGIHPEQWVIKAPNNFSYINKPLIDYLSDSYLYSMKLLFGGIGLGLFVALILAFITFLLPRIGKEMIRKVMNSLEAFPDVIFIFVFQMLIVGLYKLTGHLILDFVYYEQKIYAAPIISLSILPSILFFKVILLLLEEEWSKDYIVLARSKGLGKLFILYIHVLRNIFKSLFYQSKHIVWATLSSLIVVEYMFRLNGFLKHLMFDHSPFTTAAILIFIYTPFYLIYNSSEMWMDSRSKKLDESFSLKEAYSKNAKGFSFPNFPISMSIAQLLKYFSRLSGVFVKLLKKPKFLLGFIYLFGMTSISFIYVWMKKEPITYLGIFGPDGKLYGRLPHPPSDQFIFGSDMYGYSIFDQIIVGAKYTIIFTLLIAFLRVLFGYLLAIPYLFYLSSKWQKRIRKIADGMHYLPISLIAYVLLSPLLTSYHSEFPTAFSERIILEVLLLTVLVIPVMLNVVGSELNQMAQQEYIQSSILIGASKSRILFKHLTPNIFPRLILLFQQQVTQVSFVLINLGLFHLFFGGTIYNIGPPPEYLSYTHEWSGLISAARDALMTGNYWLIAPTLIAFILLIWSVQAMSQEIINYQQAQIGIVVKSKRVKNKELNEKTNKNVASVDEQLVFIQSSGECPKEQLL